jgi:hypothetical protein
MLAASYVGGKSFFSQTKAAQQLFAALIECRLPGTMRSDLRLRPAYASSTKTF